MLRFGESVHMFIYIYCCMSHFIFLLKLHHSIGFKKTSFRNKNFLAPSLSISFAMEIAFSQNMGKRKNG